MNKTSLILTSVVASFFLFFSPPQHYNPKSSPINLVGIWQADQPVVGSALGDAYRFYGNGTFEFQVSVDNTVSRLNTISGSYSLSDSNLTLKVEKIIENVGGNFTYEPDVDYWAFAGTRTVEKSVKTSPMIFTITVAPTDNGNECVQINMTKYYKVSSNPNGLRD